MRFFAHLVMVACICASNYALAGDLCPNPRPGSPAIAFGLTAIDSRCKSTLERARWLGFTAVSISPRFNFSRDGTLAPADLAADLERCLDQAGDMGFDIIYKPMLEPAPAGPGARPAVPDSQKKTLSDSLLRAGIANQSNEWRAKFEIDPRVAYEKKVIDPFIDWLAKRQKKGATKSLKAWIVAATELYRSVGDFPVSWNWVMWNTQKKLEAMGLRHQVQVGLDPTIFAKAWWNVTEEITLFTETSCQAFQNMLWTADFYSPSVYGNYVGNGFYQNGAQSVGGVFSTKGTEFVDSPSTRHCTLDRALQNRFWRVSWPGEIGYAGNLKESWAEFSSDPPKKTGSDADYEKKLAQYLATTFREDRQKFVETAPVWVQAVLDYARGSNMDVINLWVTGKYDIYGFSDFPSLGDPDSRWGQYTEKDPVKGPDAIPAVAKIRDELQTYTRDRCPNWAP